MRPISVRFACFGPYMEEQFVDFEALEKNGLFLICGETGAGKTTILDAICYALYGRSSGGLRGGLEVMRCALAGGDDDTLVEFVFDSNGKRYKFIRSLKFKTGKNKKSKNLNDYHNCLELQGDVEIPIVEKEQDRYVTQKAEELIGLTYDQFRQVIILPQGQFERLLVSSSEEKETILVSLFHAQRWQRIAEELQRRVAEEDKALKEERRSVEEKLRAYGCQTLAQLEEKREQRRAQLEERTRMTREAEQTLTAGKQARERSLLDDQGFQELKRRKLRFETLQKQSPAFEVEALLLADADRAESIRGSYTEYRTAAAALARAQEQLAAGEAALKEKENILAGARKQQTELERKRPAAEADQQKILLLQNAREVYSLLERREKDASAARKEAEAAASSAADAEEAYLRCQRELESAMAAQSVAMQQYQVIQKAYLQGIGATLAAGLEPGCPCPVCGSREHPAPAVSGEDPVTDSQLEAAQQRLDGTGKAVTQALQRKSAAESSRQAAQQASAEAQSKADIARSSWQQTLERRLEGIDSEFQRAALQAKLERQVRLYEQSVAALQQQLAAAMGGVEAARGLLEDARRRHTEAETEDIRARSAWEQALERSSLGSEARYRKADLAPEEKQRRQTALHQYRAERDAAEKALASQRSLMENKLPPDLAAIQKHLTEAENAYRSCVTAQTLAAKGLEDIGKDLASLADRLAAYEEARSRVDENMLFARRLRGDSGISLQRYVLGVMLTSVTTEANRLLAGVYGGRYRLFRTDEISGRGRKGGLELEVYDSQTSQRRSVTTLSGGEKFLVALSLAIGLSTVVQAQGGGVRLGAMFVDEGFGSLDRESVSDALEVLQGIRRGSGIVGIISHVEQLAEVIPTRLEITKGKHGSSCTLRA